MKKQAKRVYNYEFNTNNETAIVKLLDNKCVIFGMNYYLLHSGTTWQSPMMEKNKE